jgi:hypothetical protein
MTEKNFTIYIDPLGKFQQVPRDDLIMCLGLIPGWFSPENLEYIGLEHTADIEKIMSHSYGMPTPEMTGGAVRDDLVYQYPEDPDLYPLAVIQNDTTKQHVAIYEYAICAISSPTRGEHKYTIYRFD